MCKIFINYFNSVNDPLGICRIPFSASAEAASHIDADVDNSVAVDSADLVYSRKVLLVIIEYKDMSDVNGDGRVNIVDLVSLKKLTVLKTIIEKTVSFK